jgi:hypothetical protein
VVVVAAVPDRATAGEDREVGRRRMHVGEKSAVRRDGDPHEARVGVAQLGVVDAEVVEHPRVLALEHEVRAGDELTEARAICFDVEVEDDAALRRVVVPPPEAAVGVDHVVDERSVPPRPVPAGRLDDHHVGAEVAEQLPGVGGAVARQLDDAEPFEDRRHQITFRAARSSISSDDSPSRVP